MKGKLVGPSYPGGEMPVKTSREARDLLLRLLTPRQARSRRGKGVYPCLMQSHASCLSESRPAIATSDLRSCENTVDLAHSFLPFFLSPSLLLSSPFPPFLLKFSCVYRYRYKTALAKNRQGRFFPSPAMAGEGGFNGSGAHDVQRTLTASSGGKMR